MPLLTADARAPTRPRSAGLLRRRLPGDTVAGWVGPLAVALFAALLRLRNLGSPDERIFDETYYAKDARDLLRHGVERNSEGDAGFVVHPPLGKWAIALGEQVFGYDAFGWRVSAAVAGALTVLVLARVARRLFGSTLLGCVAGLLLALDGLHHVQSRVAMLDVFMVLWVVVAFACLVADRDDGRLRLAAAADRGEHVQRWGPWLGVRWWRVAAGLALGAAVATKWSAIFYVLVFFVLAFAWDAGARRSAGVAHPLSAALMRDVLPSVAAVFGVAIVLYTASWTGWFVSDDGWSRDWAEDNRSHWRFFPDSLANSWLVPDVVRSWVHYHWEMWHFHSTLHSNHPYASHPLSWLVLARPVAYYYASYKTGEHGCTAQEGCAAEVLAIGTPAIWWAALPALPYVLWLWVSRRDWRAPAILLPFLAGTAVWIPSDLADRTMFLFYVLPAVPFMVLGITFTLGHILGPPDARETRRTWGAIAVGAYLLVVIVNFWVFQPILDGSVIPYDEWRSRMWFKSWI